MFRLARLDDAQEPPLKRRRSSSPTPDSFSSLQPTGVQARKSYGAKVRGTVMPQEYELEKLLERITSRYDSWNVSNHACDWSGMKCNEEREVTVIDWTCCGIRGPLNWAHLPSTLKEMYACGDEIQGDLPLEDFPNHLEVLSLFDNYLRGELDFSQLPKTMKQLFLNRNDFEGHVDLTCLPTTLLYLELQQNTLCGEVRLDKLPEGLQGLNLGENEFSGTLDLEHLPTTLEELRLDHNEFEGTVDLSELPDTLSKLDLSGNTDLTGYGYGPRLPRRLGRKSFSTRGTKIEVQGMRRY